MNAFLNYHSSLETFSYFERMEFLIDYCYDFMNRTKSTNTTNLKMECDNVNQILQSNDVVNKIDELLYRFYKLKTIFIETLSGDAKHPIVIE